jgi:hypothetical protein
MLCMLCTQKFKRTNQVHNMHNMHNHLVRPSERAGAVDRRGQRRKVLCVGELETGCVVVQAVHLAFSSMLPTYLSCATSKGEVVREVVHEPPR